MEREIIAIIPARGGSKRIKGKNMKELAGKPLLWYTIAAAKAAPSVTQILVTSDNQDILDYANDEGATPVQRPKELASDSAQLEPVILHAIEKAEPSLFIDIVVVLQPTSPLRDGKYIEAAIQQFLKSNCNSLLSCSMEEGFFWDDGGEPINYDPKFANERPRVKESGLLKENGAIYITTASDFKEWNTRLPGSVDIFRMPAGDSIEIDEPHEFTAAQSRISKSRTPDGEKVFVIAEIGNNHQGDIDTAKRLIEQAAYAGADAVKSQKRDMESVPNPERPYVNKNSFGDTYGAHRRYLELSACQHAELQEYAARMGLSYFVSVWDMESADEMLDLSPALIKLPSCLLTDDELLKYLCGCCESLDTEIMLSTGMSTLDEVKGALLTAHQFNKSKRVHLLQSTSAYPCAPRDLALGVIPMYMADFSFMRVVVGFSGHHLGVGPDCGAVALGAKIVERHFTLNKTLKGTDHAASLEPHELKRLVDEIRATEAALSVNEKKVFDSELPALKKLRKSL